MGTFLQKTTRDSSKHYTKSPMASTVISTHSPPCLPSWHKIDGGNLDTHQTTILLWYEKTTTS